MNERQLKELGRLRKLYPLFTFEEEVKPSVNNMIVHFSQGNKFHCSIKNSGRVDCETMITLDTEHMEKSIGTRLMVQYPDLYISPHADRNGLSLSVWVKRNLRDAEAIDDIDVIGSNLHYKLERFQVEAMRAKQYGWFFCSGHKQATKKHDGQFFHFAGNYCKRYGEENPKVLRTAAREDYR